MKKTLCIDVGGTRIKAAIIPGSSSLNSLPAIPKTAIRSLGWLNRTLPEIVSPENWASIANQLEMKGKFNDVAICVPGPVENGRFKREDLSIPTDLLDQLKTHSTCHVSKLVKDADAWTVGACIYFKLSKKKIKYPAIALAFGTGIGLSLALNETTIYSTEISRWSYGFSRVEKISGKRISQPCKVHGILGADYFAWVAKEKRHWDYQRIRLEFTRRVVALIRDLQPKIEQDIGDIRSLIVGGGNAEFLSIRGLKEKINIDVYSLWSRKIEIDPDLIPLIGLHEIISNPKHEILKVSF